MFITDKLTLNSQRVYSDEGFLTAPALIGRTGIQEYRAREMKLTDRDPNEIIRVFRPAEEVFKKDSMSSFANKPVTNNHPPELVNSKNFKEYSVGFSGNEITQDGDFIKAEIHVTDEVAIRNIEAGKVELSNGYTCDIEWIPGVTEDGVEYEAIQTNIKGNHIAIVAKGRAGSACKVADSMSLEGDETLMKITHDGVEYEVTEQVGQVFDKLQTQLKDAEKEAEEAKKDSKAKDGDMENMKKEAKETKDALQAKLDDAKSKIPTTDSLDEMVKSRVAFIDTAKKVKADLEFEGKDEATIRKELVADAYPDVKIEDCSDEYISARFDILVEDSAGTNKLDEVLKKTVTDSVIKKPELSPSEKARQKFIDSQNGGK